MVDEQKAEYDPLTQSLTQRLEEQRCDLNQTNQINELDDRIVPLVPKLR